MCVIPRLKSFIADESLSLKVLYIVLNVTMQFDCVATVIITQISY